MFDFNVKVFGALGDGKTLDTLAIQAAINAASAQGGGRVVLPAGTYLSFSLQLKSFVELHIGNGAILLAADPETHKGQYDNFEDNPWDMYQDFGHSHWHNSLIWGENLEHIAITGLGKIIGDGLTLAGPGPRRAHELGDMPLSLQGADPHNEKSTQGEYAAHMRGLGNKAIALKQCRHVRLSDFSLLRGGHFAILTTGCDHITFNDLKIDTNRDGIDVDGCQHVSIKNCFVNSPNDDAICLKSSYALGRLSPTDNVIISQCYVSGFDVGTMLDGSYQRTQQFAPDRDGVTGRIKLGTESNGAFRNITISDCIFERSRGFAIESVDGAIIENIVVNNLVMRELKNPPIFIRLGKRMRGPQELKVGAIRNVMISQVVATDVDSRYACILAGISEQHLQNIRLSNIYIEHAGAGRVEDANREIPELDTAYPEPSMFGITPVHGVFVRHLDDLLIENFEVIAQEPDYRPAFGFYSANRIKAINMRTRNTADVNAVAWLDLNYFTFDEIN